MFSVVSESQWYHKTSSKSCRSLLCSSSAQIQSLSPVMNHLHTAHLRAVIRPLTLSVSVPSPLTQRGKKKRRLIFLCQLISVLPHQTTASPRPLALAFLFTLTEESGLLTGLMTFTSVHDDSFSKGCGEVITKDCLIKQNITNYSFPLQGVV